MMLLSHNKTWPKTLIRMCHYTGLYFPEVEILGLGAV